MSDSKLPVVVLGGTGYVAGELLRLTAAHPHLQLAGVRVGQPARRARDPIVRPPRAHLSGRPVRGARDDQTGHRPAAASSDSVGSAARRNAARLIDELFSAAEAKGARPRVVDISADFRYATAGAYEAVYKHAHGAPGRIPQFSCALPEHLSAVQTPHVAHPGCFSTAELLASVPLLKLGLAQPLLFASGVTGSTGSGRTPGPGTHHRSASRDGAK